MLRVQLWDGVSPINNVSAEEILANRKDIAANLGDVFLVVNEYDVVSEIQFGKTIASNYGMEPGKTTLEIAEAYLVKKAEEAAAAAQEQLTTEQLQEEVAMLSYEVMMLQSEAKAYTLAEGEHSPKFRMIKIWYDRGFWTAEMVADAVAKNVITEAERAEIVGA